LRVTWVSEALFQNNYLAGAEVYVLMHIFCTYFIVNPVKYLRNLLIQRISLWRTKSS
jgi:hypothetical protein